MRFSLRLLVSTLLCTLFLRSFTAAAANFSDVGRGHGNFQAIHSLSNVGLIKGYADQTFKPDKTINRAEALKVLIEARFDRTTIDQALDGHRAKRHRYVNLPDVALGDWFSPYVEVAYAHGIAKGYADNQFKPMNSINLAEGLKMILAAYGIQPKGILSPSKLLYVNSGDWFAPYFAYATEKNLLNANKFYHPAQVLTRGEFTEIVYRMNTIQAGHLTHYTQGNGVINSKEYTVTIPRLNIINQPVGFADLSDEEKSLDVLKKFPLGHYLATPDSGKKFVLFGHSSGYAWDKSPYKVALRQINKLQPGDKIYINYKERGYVYVIGKTETILAQEDSRIVDNLSSNEIAMYTCWPPDSIRQRYVVYAKPV